ncbi:MAG TPA: nuclear transport factor 2 family protein [Acidobacteriota bacterium]|nr:nuclear transport factor 2 family protein [Acidobacteriota bacterium]
MHAACDPTGRFLVIALICIVCPGLFIAVVMAEAEREAGSMNNEWAAVEQTIHNCFGWAVEKDFDLFYRTIADDSDFISVTPYSKVKFGVDDVKAGAGFWASPDFKAISHEVHDLRITFSREGDVAWFYCVLDDLNEWKGQPANWEKVRWTGVVEKRDGRWRIVQQHFSWPKED